MAESEKKYSKSQNMHNTHNAHASHGVYIYYIYTDVTRCWDWGDEFCGGEDVFQHWHASLVITNSRIINIYILVRRARSDRVTRESAVPCG